MTAKLNGYDGRCHNAEPGTYNHECGKPATWIGEKANGRHSGFCDACKERGSEARPIIHWFKPKFGAATGIAPA